MTAKISLSVLLLLVSWGLAQDRFTSGELQGFTKSATEGIINRIDEPLTVSSFKGTVSREVGDRSPLKSALVEIRGPGHSPTIRATKTDKRGNFHIKHVPAGQYTFKITSLGFQSVIGTVTISPAAGSGHNLERVS